MHLQSRGVVERAALVVATEVETIHQLLQGAKVGAGRIFAWVIYTFTHIYFYIYSLRPQQFSA